MPDYTGITRGGATNLLIRNGEYEQTRRTFWARVAVAEKSRRWQHGRLNQQPIVGSFAPPHHAKLLTTNLCLWSDRSIQKNRDMP